MEIIAKLKNTTKYQIKIYVIFIIINIVLTILSISLDSTNSYTKEHISLYIISLIFACVNCAYNYNIFKKLNKLSSCSNDIEYVKVTLKNIGCNGFYYSIANIIWFSVGLILESVIIDDTTKNSKQAILIIEYLMIIIIAFCNILTTCNICNKSYDSIKDVDEENLRKLGFSSINQINPINSTNQIESTKSTKSTANENV